MVPCAQRARRRSRRRDGGARSAESGDVRRGRGLRFGDARLASFQLAQSASETVQPRPAMRATADVTRSKSRSRLHRRPSRGRGVELRRAAAPLRPDAATPKVEPQHVGASRATRAAAARSAAHGVGADGRGGEDAERNNVRRTRARRRCERDAKLASIARGRAVRAERRRGNEPSPVDGHRREPRLDARRRRRAGGRRRRSPRARVAAPRACRRRRGAPERQPACGDLLRRSAKSARKAAARRETAPRRAAARARSTAPPTARATRCAPREAPQAFCPSRRRRQSGEGGVARLPRPAAAAAPRNAEGDPRREAAQHHERSHAVARVERHDSQGREVGGDRCGGGRSRSAGPRGAQEGGADAVGAPPHAPRASSAARDGSISS